MIRAANTEGGDRCLVSEFNTSGPGPPDTEKKEMPTAPEELLQWLWLDPTEKRISLTKQEGFRLLVFPTAQHRRSFLQQAEKLGYTILQE